MSEWNRQPGKTAADVNLDGAPHGFKVTGDAAWDSDSEDYAMFSPEGNVLVAGLVKEARVRCRLGSETTVTALLELGKQQIEHAGHGEVRDTMVCETIAYALDAAWQEAYGHRYGEEG
jgi:hypothetical protein